ncbi:hypothetical protein [Okeania sp. SIO3I5]|nr:hypothetical protein [Okeania sp. SIO3I5]
MATGIFCYVKLHNMSLCGSQKSTVVRPRVGVIPNLKNLAICD